MKLAKSNMNRYIHFQRRIPHIENIDLDAEISPPLPGVRGGGRLTPGRARGEHELQTPAGTIASLHNDTFLGSVHL